MMGGSKTTTTSSNQIDPELMKLYNQNYARANEIADRPYQPYIGERVAKFTPWQLQGMDALAGIAQNNVGADTLAQARSIYNGVANGGLLKDTDLSPYLNPYTQNVIDRSLSDLARQRDIQRVADNQTATKANAFGGSRQGVADSLTNEAYLRNVANTSATLHASAYDKAVERAIGDINLRLGTANSLAGLSNQEMSQAAQRAGYLSAAGAMQQQQQQAMNDAAYQDFLAQWTYPLQQQQMRNAALGMMPVQSTQTSTQQSDPGGLGILSAVLGGVKTVAGLGK
jgi:hypothetical protein